MIREKWRKKRILLLKIDKSGQMAQVGISQYVQYVFLGINILNADGLSLHTQLSS